MRSTEGNTTAVKKCRQQKRDSGLVPVELWVPEKDKYRIKEMADNLVKSFIKPIDII